MRNAHSIRRRLWLLAMGAAAVLAPAKAQERGVVAVSVASLREAPSHASQLETQAVMGTEVMLGETQGDWRECQTPDGYRAYIHRSAFVAPPSEQLARWEGLPKLMVSSLERPRVVVDTLSACCAEPLCDLVNGALVAGERGAGRFSAVELPDGRRGYVMTSDLRPFDPASAAPLDVERLLAVARSMMGTPYLWGGTSTLGVDCSGLTRVAFWDQGILLPRNASQQALVGEPVEPALGSLQPGDLLFFAAHSEGERITHVGIYEGEGRVVHASGTVHRSQLFTDTVEMLPQRLRSARRIGRADNMLRCGAGAAGDASSAVSDDGAPRDRRFNPASLVAPGAMIAVGAWGAAHKGALWRVNKWVGRELGGERKALRRVSDVVEFLPDAAMLLPDGWIGESRYSWRERAALTVTGALIAEAIAQPVKLVVGCRRPDGSDDHSFPSGHTATAFVGAELLRISYGWGWASASGYLVATACAAMRVASSRHWLTDVVGGAGVGILSAQLARLLLPAERRLAAGSRFDLMAAATYSPQCRGPLVALALTL